MTSSANLLQWIVISLLGLAVVMVNSAGMSVGDDPVTLSGLLLGQTTLYALIAVAVMAVVSHLDIRRLYRTRGTGSPVVWLLLGSMLLCAAALVPGLGKSVNGASRWLYLGPESWGLSFQPSELAKWTAVAAMAWWGARYAGRMGRLFDGLLPALLMLGAVCGLIIIEDLGTAVLIGSAGLLVLIAAGAKLWHVALLAPPALAAVGGLILTSPYRVERLMVFMHPWADPRGAGYQAIQSKIAVAGGEIVGRGLGNGVQKFGYLPEDTTDFLFAIICEELGVAGAALVIGLYLALIWVGLSVIRDCRHPFGRLLGLGVLATITIQAVMNIAVVTVVVPTKGIALPLLSRGGTGWVMCAAAIGLLAAIDRLNRVESQVSNSKSRDEESNAEGNASSLPMPEAGNLRLET